MKYDDLWLLQPQSGGIEKVRMCVLLSEYVVQNEFFVA